MNEERIEYLTTLISENKIDDIKYNPSVPSGDIEELIRELDSRAIEVYVTRNLNFRFQGKDYAVWARYVGEYETFSDICDYIENEGNVVGIFIHSWTASTYLDNRTILRYALKFEREEEKPEKSNIKVYTGKKPDNWTATWDEDDGVSPI